MKTSYKADERYGEHDHVGVKKIELDHQDLIKLIATGLIEEKEFVGGQVIQVSVIILRAKIGPEV